MTEQKKIKRAALVLMGLVGVLLLGLVISCVKMFTDPVIWSAVTLAHFIVGLLFTLSALGIALLLLASIGKSETPFTRKNVQYLKIMGALLVVYEIYSYLASRTIHTLSPIRLEGGITVTMQASLNGAVLAAGLVVYCVALIFQYGISLQQQADETL